MRNSGWRFAAGDSDYSQHGYFGERRARNEDTVRVGVEIRRRDLDTVVDERKEIVGDDAFQGFAIEKSKTEPKAIELGAAKEGFALRFEVVIEIAHKIDGANLGEGKLVVLAVLGEQVDGVELAEARGVQVPAQGFVVVQRDDHLFVGRGWSAEFQRTGFPLVEVGNLHGMKLYVMLSAKFLSTYCF